MPRVRTLSAVSLASRSSSGAVGPPRAQAASLSTTTALTGSELATTKRTKSRAVICSGSVSGASTSTATPTASPSFSFLSASALLSARAFFVSVIWACSAFAQLSTAGRLWESLSVAPMISSNMPKRLSGDGFMYRGSVGDAGSSVPGMTCSIGRPSRPPPMP
jgi:hypothetical protein